MNSLPSHLRKYVVEQNYEKYTPIDHAVWRYILKQLRAFLGVHAHESYLDGLEKTGIDLERIPKISNISAKLEKFGWRAIPVSGFIPPAAFMELQSLGVLPIASDMRSIDHLLYTPAPDIVHEAAGHAPILIHPEFADYLRQYAQVAKKAIISKEDLDLYEAIRDLSDIKENPNSTPEQISAAEKHLNQVSNAISHISEASELSRMNWWTAEYGLIGSIDSPKIFGAGLLSSVGESKRCLSDHVKKIPLGVNCIQTSYDITEPQPQLFVAKDFKDLVRVLHEMAATMAFKKGGLEGLEKIKKAKSVNTAQLNTGLQISGQLEEYLTHRGSEVIFLRFTGPSQLSYQDQQLPGHGRNHHPHGYSTPLGDLSEALDKDLKPGQPVHLKYKSGFEVRGLFVSYLEKQGQKLLITLKEATATYEGRTYFEPSWGEYDIALGTHLPSVFGGPADRLSYGELDDFVAAKVPAAKYSALTLKLHAYYQKVRDLRESPPSAAQLEKELRWVYDSYKKEFSQDWLLRLEILELASAHHLSLSFENEIREELKQLASSNPNHREVIEDGLRLVRAS